jgi:hypothetical protein
LHLCMFNSSHSIYNILIGPNAAHEVGPVLIASSQTLKFYPMHSPRALQHLRRLTHRQKAASLPKRLTLILKSRRPMRLSPFQASKQLRRKLMVLSLTRNHIPATPDRANLLSFSRKQVVRVLRLFSMLPFAVFSCWSLLSSVGGCSEYTRSATNLVTSTVVDMIH